METHAKDDMVTEEAVFDALRYRVEVNAYGTCKYYNKAGQLHREGAAAVEQANGGKRWYQNGKRHRIDGPAVECFGGHREWWINGVELPVYQDELNTAL